MRKSLLIIVMVVFITGNIFGSQIVEAHNNSFLDEAEVLKELNIFKGSNLGFELNRAATRVEGAVIVVRLLGMEDYVLDNTFDHPFNDVPVWADQYVGYLYEEGLTNGMSSDIYGSFEKLTPNQFMTFSLRSIGYNDINGDFIWSEAVTKALELEIIDETYETYLSGQENIYRDDVVGVLYNLLNVPMKDSEEALIQKLIKKNVFTLEKALELNIYKQFYLYEDSIVITELIEDIKAVVVTEKQGVKYFIEMPFSRIEESYTSCIVGSNSTAVEYKIYISKEMYIEQQLKDYNIGDSLNFVGELSVNMAEKKDNIDCFYYLPK